MSDITTTDVTPVGGQSSTNLVQQSQQTADQQQLQMAQLTEIDRQSKLEQWKAEVLVNMTASMDRLISAITRT